MHEGLPENKDRSARNHSSANMSGEVVDYANEKEWRRTLKQNPRLKMHEIIEALGLRTNKNQGKRGKTNFDNPEVRALVSDIDRVVGIIPDDPEDLITFISSPNSLSDELDQLLSKHGSKIWGRSGSRPHLLRAGTPRVNAELYPRDLFFEDEDDRRTIRVLLHWWIGQKASNVIFARERYARKRRERNEDSVGNLSNDTVGELLNNSEISTGVATTSTPSPHLALGSEVQTPIQVLQDQGRSTSCSPSLASDSPPISRHSPNPNEHGPPIGYNSLTLRERNNAPTHVNTLSQMDSRQAASDLAAFASNLFLDDREVQNVHEHGLAVNAIPQTESHNDHARFGGNPALRSLDTETLQALRTYVYPSEAGQQMDEDLLLLRLEKAWRDIARTNYNRLLHSPILFAARDEAFLTWIEIRRTFLGAIRIIDGNAKLDKELAIGLANSFQRLCRSWQRIGEGLNVLWAPKMSANELLVQAFIMLAGSNNTADMIWGPVNALNHDGRIDAQTLGVPGEEEQATKLFYVDN
ncbi:uncharacterized protein BDR25DRAFT_341325 [Lindgomyces ingoldianus]|uniref:Uncharacterized protein n=1 Tax=Lindgomyces ingoldianus TaxID=673940 RepID=A0ACB6R3T5_9PLEO|nr:uncharacterized protein BDR25DRAFT_341325 [Lindgomyces ingoldianus]KAF2473172.1 hypothetical protein BDR25DRAFT_341325 [Lindgomyces ingoldianus]